MAIVLILLVSGLFIVSAFYAHRIYCRHVLGEQAPEQTVAVRILDKQRTRVSDPRPGEDSSTYWIYVQPLQGGPKREFEVGVHDYHAIHPGDQGVLTYQGLTYRHFGLRRS